MTIKQRVQHEYRAKKTAANKQQPKKIGARDGVRRTNEICNNEIVRSIYSIERNVYIVHICTKNVMYVHCNAASKEMRT